MAVLTATLVLSGFAANLANAETSKSTNYQVTQTELGGSSTLQTCSSTYCARSSAGGSTAEGDGTDPSGNVLKTNGDTQAEPELTVAVTAGVGDLGNLSSTKTATRTMSVSVVNRLSNGYVLQIVGASPHYAGHQLKSLSSPSASQTGVEQFGINAVKNVAPNIGADPIQKPSGETSFGEVADNYKVADKFMYSDGDVVALSRSSSGETDYTVSMIINISNSTPAGRYSSDFAAVIVPIY